MPTTQYVVDGSGRERYLTRLVVDVQEGQDPRYVGLLAIWADGGTAGDTLNQKPPTPEQFQALKETGLLALSWDDEDGFYTVLWLTKDGNLGFGTAEGTTIEDTDKYENTWVKVEPWAVDEDRKAALLALSKEELVERLLREETRR